MKNNPTSWVVSVFQDPDSDDLMMEIPKDILSNKGWNTGDTLLWTDNGDGSWTLSKQCSDITATN